MTIEKIKKELFRITKLYIQDEHIDITDNKVMFGINFLNKKHIYTFEINNIKEKLEEKKELADK